MKVSRSQGFGSETGSRPTKLVAFYSHFRSTRLRKRDLAILAVLVGCGLRRRELADLEFTQLQQREEDWAIVGLIGKGCHIRTFRSPSGSKLP